MNQLKMDQVALVGRTYNEYKRMFDITRESLENKKVLDVASGVSNFCAIGNAFGLDITAVDPIYNLMADEIELRCEEDLNNLMNQLPVLKSKFNWEFYGDLEGLRISRVKAYETFLKDYQSSPSKYIYGEIQNLPFENKSFDVTVVSHMLFLYDHLYDEEFHIQALKELVRVTNHEVIIFPTKNVNGELSDFVDRLKTSTDFLDCTFLLEQSQFEFQDGANFRLRITPG